jgi:hypothetical protein
MPLKKEFSNQHVNDLSNEKRHADNYKTFIKNQSKQNEFESIVKNEKFFKSFYSNSLEIKSESKKDFEESLEDTKIKLNVNHDLKLEESLVDFEDIPIKESNIVPHFDEFGKIDYFRQKNEQNTVFYFAGGVKLIYDDLAKTVSFNFPETFDEELSKKIIQKVDDSFPEMELKEKTIVGESKFSCDPIHQNVEENKFQSTVDFLNDMKQYKNVDIKFDTNTGKCRLDMMNEPDIQIRNEIVEKVKLHTYARDTTYTCFGPPEKDENEKIKITNFCEYLKSIPGFTAVDYDEIAGSVKFSLKEGITKNQRKRIMQKVKKYALENGIPPFDLF